MRISSVVTAALAGREPVYHCSSFNASITVTAPSYQPAFPPFQNHYHSVAFLNNLSARNASATASPFSGVKNVTETFSINAEYCTPNHHNGPLDVQVLTHGLGFDKSYWQLFGPPSEYNYVSSATAAEYATLAYSRIGNGLSSAPDPYTIQQAPTELAVLSALTEKLRAASAPDLSDGIVLTGYSTNFTWQIEFAISTSFHLARENQPARFGKRSTGSLTWGDELANQYSFLAYPFFDPAVLAYAEANKFPFSIGELLTQTLLPLNASSFAKPALVSNRNAFLLSAMRGPRTAGKIISGDADLIFCDGDCYGILEQSAPLFASASPFQTYVQPHTGHGMNLHYNASGTYEVVQSFLQTNA